MIEAEARRARAVFNSEPGRPTGAVVTGRKGGVFMKCEVTGKAAHSGGNFEQGISAIEAGLRIGCRSHDELVEAFDGRSLPRCSGQHQQEGHSCK